MIRLAGWSIKLPSHLTRLVFFLMLSGGLMILDYRGHHLETIRSGLKVIFSPLEFMAAFPPQMAAWARVIFRGHGELQRDYDRLQAEQLLLLAKLQKYEALEADNAHLRQLLDSATRVADRAIVAELREVSPGPHTQKIVIAKGSSSGIYRGQPVIDAYGIVGQISEVGPFTSKATLITDPSHAIPVQVVRNGLRAIVFGNGAYNQPDVRYLTASADIQVGDVLISSGMGGTFPPGYPVAQVVKIITDPNEAFLKILVQPLAHLNHGKEVMLIWPGDQRLAANPTATDKSGSSPRKPAGSKAALGGK
jgi:rod shape-determining protein MreC